MKINYRTDLVHVDWDEMKAAVAVDDFDNGRTPDQLRPTGLEKVVGRWLQS